MWKVVICRGAANVCDCCGWGLLPDPRAQEQGWRVTLRRRRAPPSFGCISCVKHRNAYLLTESLACVQAQVPIFFSKQSSASSTVIHALPSDPGLATSMSIQFYFLIPLSRTQATLSILFPYMTLSVSMLQAFYRHPLV